LYNKKRTAHTRSLSR